MATELRRLREAAGLTQAELARRAGVSVGSIRWWESGQRTMSVPGAMRLARVLGVDMNELTGFHEHPPLERRPRDQDRP